MEKIFSQENVNLLKLSSGPTSIINIESTDSRFMQISCQYSDPEMKFKEKKEDYSYKLKIKLPDKENNKMEWENIVDNVKKIILNTLLDEDNNLFTPKQPQIQIDVKIPECLNELILNINDGKIYLNKINIPNFTCIGNNVKVYVDKACHFRNSNYSLNNCRLHIPILSDEDKLTINGNNSKIFITPGEHFSGKLFVTGNLVKMTDFENVRNDKIIIKGNLIKIKREINS